MSQLTYEQIKPYIEKRLISEQSHPDDSNVRIFNYTHSCQYAHAWDDVTVQCRGLIMNVATGEVLARPFPKFFNYEEHAGKKLDIPNEKPLITEKLDGSLGIMYTLHGKTWIATRGSFTSDQAIWATDWWRANKGPEPYGNEITYLFEIIYPENRIVVNYDFSGLVHIASIDTATGKQVSQAMPVRKAKLIDATDIASLAQLEKPNSEGFVIFYPSTQLRLKIKFPEYIRLHRILTGVSARVIWDLLRNKQDLAKIIEQVPDEFYNWVKNVKESLEKEYHMYAQHSTDQFNLLEVSSSETRAHAAEKIKKMQHPNVGFAMLDNRDYSQIIWKMLKPKAEKPFKEDADNT